MKNIPATNPPEPSIKRLSGRVDQKLIYGTPSRALTAVRRVAHADAGAMYDSMGCTLMTPNVS